MRDKKFNASIIIIILLQMQNIDGCNSSACFYYLFTLHSYCFLFITDFSPTSTIWRSFADEQLESFWYFWLQFRANTILVCQVYCNTSIGYFYYFSALLYGLLYIKSFSAIFIFHEREHLNLFLLKFVKSLLLHQCFIYKKILIISF